MSIKITATNLLYTWFVSYYYWLNLCQGRCIYENFVDFCFFFKSLWTSPIINFIWLITCQFRFYLLSHSIKLFWDNRLFFWNILSIINESYPLLSAVDWKKIFLTLGFVDNTRRRMRKTGIVKGCSVPFLFDDN